MFNKKTHISILFKPSIFLTLLSLLIFYLFKKTYDTFIFNAITKTTLININIIFWIFGFSFLPSFFLWAFFMFKKDYYKSNLSLLWLFFSDILFAFIFKESGPIGIIFLKYKNFYTFFLTLLGFIITSYFLNLTSTIKKEIKNKIIKNNPSLPSISLLKIGIKEKIIIDTTKQKALLIKILKDFGIQIKITQIMCGPVVTLYAAELEAGIKASKVISLANDIARSMETFSTRIATIPGKNLLGIEISNEKRQIVYFKEGLLTQKYQNFSGNLPIYLGTNIYGDHEVFDLSKMPHLLVAGTTGSGKSVGIHTMLLSILFKKNHDEVKLILIDPKKLELAAYEEIPHLLLPVVTEAKEAIIAVKWAVNEMEERYRKMALTNARNITSFNNQIKNSSKEKKLPFIVIVIDEMADLILLAGKEFELYVQRLAQMGRACGIHIIMATQRPSVDVITGTIKANFPSRISFKLSTKVDSRTILGDSGGAEQLLGAGDMLYLGNDGKIVRIHGSFVSEKDTEQVVNFWKSVAKPNYIKLPEPDFSEIDLSTDDDSYYAEAIELIKKEKKVSASFLQRNFPIGYNRAAKIIERMEKENIISKGDKFGRNREIL